MLIRIAALALLCFASLGALQYRYQASSTVSDASAFNFNRKSEFCPEFSSRAIEHNSPDSMLATASSDPAPAKYQVQLGGILGQNAQSGQDAQSRQGNRGFQRGGMGGGFGGGSQSKRSDYPMWTLDPSFEKDIFTFIRIQFDSYGGRGGGMGCMNDFPDCDWSFSVRLTQLTSFKVHPDGDVIRLTDDRLFDYPFVFMTNLGGMQLSDAEQKAFRRYLLNGGFVMADDFWAAYSWQHIRQQMKLVLPDREPVELKIDHPLFHIVYDFASLPQVPSIRAWQRGMGYEDWHGPFENGDTSPHFWGYHDDNGRLVALFCHNNDIADGWEREGEEVEYFRNYSVKWSYPLGINIVTYAMTQ